MAQLFELTEDATADLEEPDAYLAERSETAALRVADALESAFLLLGQHPDMGHKILESASVDQIRFWTAAGYLIAYLQDRSPILILAVLHGARDAAGILPDRLGRL